MAHLQEGREDRETALSLRVGESTIHDWMKRFKIAGLDGLRESPRSGAKRKLAVNLEAQVKEAVIELQSRHAGGRITGHDTQAMLAEQFQVGCCLNSVYNLLARLGVVWITPRSKHPKQNQESQETFKKTFGMQ